MEVSVIIPCLNECRTIGSCIVKATKALKKGSFLGEIVIADNGSNDGSTEIGKKLGARVVEVSEKGYGNALMRGIEAAKGKYIVMGDADDTYDFAYIGQFVKELELGYDLVVGCRFPSGGGKIMPGSMPWKNQWFGTPILNFLGRLFFKAPVRDFHCGLRSFTKDAFKKMNLHSTGMEFASEMIIKATIMNMRISEIPIVFYKNNFRRKPHLRPWRDGWRHLSFMLLWSPNWLFLIPGIFMMLCSSISFGILLFGPIDILNIYFDTNTMLISAMGILIGFQLISFSLFTQTAAIFGGFSANNVAFKKMLNNKLEIGIGIGIFLSLSGLVILAYSVWYWKIHDFGNLSYPESLRIMIPCILFITLGIQTIFASFFLNILKMDKK